MSDSGYLAYSGKTIHETQTEYNTSVKQWVVEEKCLNTDDHEEWSHAIAVFDEELVAEMDRCIKDVAVAGYGDSDNYVYTWDATLIPKNRGLELWMNADYTPKRRWYNKDGDYISNPDKYFQVLQQQGLDRQLAYQEAINTILSKVDTFASQTEAIRSDLGLSKLK